MTKKSLQRLVALHTTTWDTWGPTKDEYLRLCAAAGREILKQLGQGGQVRVNRAGPAVRGDVIVHAERVYVNLVVACPGQTGWPVDQRFMYRACSGLQDYIGGRNLWADARDVLTLAETDGALVQRLREVSRGS